MLDEGAHRNILAALDAAISRCIDAFNIASEAGDTELAEAARARVNGLKAFRDEVSARPTRPARWMQARSPRGDARQR
ncbi:MAG TPA: hypothetical protein VKU86_13245 [Acidimicrobiales bacterium]|nr:hypothetical protein [Acidimicrobiales bacterium]